ncbi:MAG: P-II family nitrogen regulator [Desulfovibrionaceae bacterium]|nr:P-II family nitrogen regulator [Desulfovibrionaceae bacterium]
MSVNLSIPGQMLMCMVGRSRGNDVVAIAKQAGAHGGTIALGHTMNDSRILQMLSLADVDQDIVFTLLGSEADAVVSAIIDEAVKQPKKLTGMAILVNVSEIFVRGTAQEKYALTESANARSLTMQSDYELITVIVNYGFANDVMEIARKAGARGGTIVNARGTGTAEDVKFFGITLVPEKEMLFIVAEKSKVQPILNEVNAIPNLCKPGGGIVFNLPISRFVILGKEQERLLRQQN